MFLTQSKICCRVPWLTSTVCVVSFAVIDFEVNFKFLNNIGMNDEKKFVEPLHCKQIFSEIAEKLNGRDITEFRHKISENNLITVQFFLQ